MTESSTVRGDQRLTLARCILLHTPEGDEYQEDNECIAAILERFLPLHECTVSGHERMLVCNELLHGTPENDPQRSAAVAVADLLQYGTTKESAA